VSTVWITGGTVIDGTGTPGRLAEVLIEGERIISLQDPGSAAPDGAERIDATGLVVAPGFIDVMSHSVSSLLAGGQSLGKVHQGVTSEIMGEGWTYAAPGQLSEGVREVWVNGVRVLRGGQLNGALPGHRLYGPGAKRVGNP
jgi:cytosine/adenosine deaminase-related metal-dependent hydrolase